MADYVEVVPRNLSQGAYVEAHDAYSPRLLLGAALVAWLRADRGIALSGSFVTDWRDQSQYGWLLSQGTATNRPIYTASQSNIGNRPSVYFDGVDNFLQTAAAADPLLNCLHNGLGVTVLAVIRPDTGTISNRGQIIGTFNSGTDLGGGLRYEPDQSDLNFVGGTGAATSINGRSGANFPPATTQLVRAHHATSLNPDQDFFINGTQGGAGSARDYLTAPSTGNTTGKLTVGAGSLGTVAFYKGYLSEVLVVNRLLTTRELYFMRLYFNSRYGLGWAGA